MTSLISLLACLVGTSWGLDVVSVGGAGETGTYTGNKIITGTMTIQGNAFSVGGSTFSVANGSVTIGAPSANRALLHVGDGSDAIISYPTAANLYIAKYGPVASVIRDSYNDTQQAQYCAGTCWLDNQTGIYSYYSDGHSFRDHGGSLVMLDILNTSGNIGVNDATPDAQLDIKSKSAESGYAVLVSSQNDTSLMLAVQGNGETRGPKIKMSPTGGYLILMVNGTGAIISSGTIVNSTNSAVDYGFELNPIDGDQPLGSVYGPEAGGLGACADAANCWVCVSGICPFQIKPGGTCTRGNWLGASDDAGTAGYAECLTEPASAAKHDLEVGHSITDIEDSNIVWGAAHRR